MRDTDVNQILQRARGHNVTTISINTNSGGPELRQASIQTIPSSGPFRPASEYFSAEEVRDIVYTCESTNAQEEESTEENFDAVRQAMEEVFDPDTSVENIEVPDDDISDYSNVIARDETARFSSAEWFAKAQTNSIIVAGQGGIGSWTTLLLSRLRPVCITIYDSDVVELVNLAGQLYGSNNVGQLKVNAMCALVHQLSNYYSVYSCPYNYDTTRPTEDIMICGFDNMNARRMFFESWKGRVSRCSGVMQSNQLYIDGRLTATEIQVFCITGEDTELIRRYENEFLFDDEEASQEVCSFKQTAYLANMIAGMIVNLYVNFCANQTGTPFKRSLPFITKYNTDMMVLSTEN